MSSTVVRATIVENISLLRSSNTKQILIPPVETGGHKCFAPPERGKISFLACSQRGLGHFLRVIVWEDVLGAGTIIF
jgi:hypothetical protein